MATYRALADILDETFVALSSFDCDKLQALEQRIVLLSESNARFEADEIKSVLLKKRRLEIILKNCQINLDALSRLHVRNTRNQWAQ
jgi:hypothetical protein